MLFIMYVDTMNKVAYKDTSGVTVKKNYRKHFKVWTKKVARAQDEFYSQ